MKIIGRKTVKGDKTSAPKAVKAGAGTTAKAATTSSAAVKPAPTHDEIAKRAYELYLARGGEHGHADEDWARAESELGA
ncbi:MAG TPA: DUF2934 domain-containing protein [Polyangia bacterium]|nr:DUF2934 domain-containing protein [Polyangia bacterium]